MASIRDVAKRANVGLATVSRVLNNSGYVSEETREKIENAMTELNYILVLCQEKVQIKCNQFSLF